MTCEHVKQKRIYVDHALKSGVLFSCSSNQAHYLVHVLRLKVGDRILVFNGADGEWSSSLKTITKACVSLETIEQVNQKCET